VELEEGERKRKAYVWNETQFSKDEFISYLAKQVQELQRAANGGSKDKVIKTFDTILEVDNG